MADKTIQRSNMTQTDAKGKVTRSPKDSSMGEIQNFRWWKLDEKDIAPAVAQTLKFIQNHQSSRLEQMAVSSRLYGSRPAFNLTGISKARAGSSSHGATSQRISYNLCSSVIDTLVSKMAKNKVIPTFVTNGGVWDVQKKAKNLTKFSQGWFYQEDVHRKTIDGLRDGSVWGDGFVYVFRKNDKACVERVLPHEIFVDMIESECTDPRSLHRVKMMDRDIAMEMFPDLEEHIATVSPATYQDVGGYGTSADLITVTESWHLPSGPDAKDGIKAICVGDGSLVDPWEKDYFPFPHFSYNRRLLGYYGQGACERLQNLQCEISRNMMLVQKSLWMGGSFKVLLENGSKVVSQHINNDVGTIIHYTGTPPQYIVPPVVQPDVYQWIDSLIGKGYKQEGVGQMSAAAEKPMGVDSGKAMRTLTDIEDDRFRFMSQEMETFTLEINRQAIQVVKEIFEDKGSYEVVFPSNKFMETIDWKDINLDESDYVLKAYPTSSLSDDISGRLSDVQELMQAGLISPRTGKRLMDMPDVEMNENLSNAAEDLLHKVFEDMLDEGKYRAPEPFWDLGLAKQLCGEYYNYADYMNAPDDKLQLLRNFNAQLLDMTAPPPMAPTAVGPPMANPTPTPVSPMVPNVNTGMVQ